MPLARSTRRLRRQTRIVTGLRNVSPLPPRLEVLPRQPQPTVSSEDGHETLRLRQHGNRSLPLPPLLDPIRVAAKGRCTARKQDVDESEQTDFQKQLAANPFGAHHYHVHSRHDRPDTHLQLKLSQHQSANATLPAPASQPTSSNRSQQASPTNPSLQPKSPSVSAPAVP